MTASAETRLQTIPEFTRDYRSRTCTTVVRRASSISQSRTQPRSRVRTRPRSILDNRLLDDACAVVVGGVGLVGVLEVARMLLTR